MTENATGHIYTVSKLTREIKTLLEETFPFVWVTGEISNYAVPISGHAYFTLKDAQAAIQCVLFKNQRTRLPFHPDNGMHIHGLARLSLYEPRGTYQLIFEHLAPEGAGSLQVAFEQLKKKLSDQGLFDSIHKKPIPFPPSYISVITSGTGAALKDIVHVSRRRFSGCRLEIVPVQVQGAGSEKEITEAVKWVNERRRADLIILARGGGSLEDLAAFNSECVAMAIYNSEIPIITGIGHETDYTIADFVADLRAPTPSAAAELALPDKKQLMEKIGQFRQRLWINMTGRLATLNQHVFALTSRLKSPEMTVYESRMKLGDLASRIISRMRQYVRYNREKTEWLTDMLQTLSPITILNRGYSVIRRAEDLTLITTVDQTRRGDRIEIILAGGRLTATVETIHD